MLKKTFLFIILLFGLTYAVSGFNNPFPIKITGKITCNKKPIESVSITDGVTVVLTDKNGRYSMTSSSQMEFVYYSLPSGYESPVIDGVPVFYKPIHKQEKKQKINFEVFHAQQSQNKHTFIAAGDPQVRNLDDCEKLKLVIDDMKKTIDVLTVQMPVHVISMGDNVFDRTELYDTYKQIISKTNVPFYQVLGNHDMDYNKNSGELSRKSYSAKFGPTYYSFNKGNIHYVVLDDVFYYGSSYRYMGYIDKNQLAWLKKDLSTVKHGSTVIVSFHIPTIDGDVEKATNYASTLANSVMNKKALFKILTPFNTHILSGHSHTQWNTIISENVFEHTHSALCAAWWQGEIGTDGTPKGYTVYEVSGDNLSWYFKGVGMDKEDQFRLYPMGAEPLYPDSIIANVYNYDPSWKVLWFENDILMGEMEQYWGKDPLAKSTYKPKTNKKYSWLRAGVTHHLFKAKIINKESKITVKVTDRFGNTTIKNL